VDYIHQQLAFNEQVDCLKFLEEQGLAFNKDKTKVDAKASMAVLQNF
jgi:hypothetical protein